MLVLMIIFIVICIIFCTTLTFAYIDLRESVEIMKSTIKFQNEQYNTCLEGWDGALKLATNVHDLNNEIINANKQLLSEFDKIQSNFSIYETEMNKRIDKVRDDTNERMDAFSEAFIKHLKLEENHHDDGQ